MPRITVTRERIPTGHIMTARGSCWNSNTAPGAPMHTVKGVWGLFLAGYYAIRPGRLAKDTADGHWELMGLNREAFCDIAEPVPTGAVEGTGGSPFWDTR